MSKTITFNTLLFLLLFLLSGCIMNSPYPSDEERENVYYSTFQEPPKRLDPAVSYSSDELSIIGLIYEPPLEYHYLKRPYTVIPVTVKNIPPPVNYDKDGNVLSPEEASPDKVSRSVYELHIKKSIMYQNHPAFVVDEKGQMLYGRLTEQDVSGIDKLQDFPEAATRELVAGDYIYQIKRLADPRLHCPVLSIMQEYILGMKEYGEQLKEELERIRAERKKAAGPAYNQAVDEKTAPVVLDYNKFPLEGVQEIDRYTYRIILKTKYPQFIYWLTLPFFAPMPEEVIQFYSQRVLMEKNINLDSYPVGTGPYRIEVYNPNKEIILVRNENYHEDYYPGEGDESDPAELISDKGKRLPFIDKLVMKLEKEAIPRWNKFLQGYFDASGIAEETFDSVIQFSVEGEAELTDFMIDRKIHLETSVQTATYYMGFNMLDKTVGGYGEKQTKLRKAISIALDAQELIDIFANGRGIAAMSPLPPEIFGYQ
ncbi:MAG TPA: ABC transporter substrate-binding protein, partial [Thermodesulfovibrionia bacterium]|nr:ABC transporter substrate-binding protein [Thermodesulfovibrionia bacterium]